MDKIPAATPGYLEMPNLWIDARQNDKALSALVA
jgi:hypothetical protein